MKTLKRLTALLLVVVMVFSLAACGSKESGGNDSAQTSGPDDSQNVKIGVLVSDVTSAEALAFRAYYEEYIQEQYNVTFMYSDELADAAAEASAIDNFIANNCKAIISFASADRPAQIEQCEQNGVYYAVATGTLTEEQYEQYKGYEHYVGAIGPDLYTEYMAGYNMAKYYLDQGYTKFGMFGGATPYYTEMHIYRAAGMLVAMCEAGNGTYMGANDMGSMIGAIYGAGCQLEPAVIGDVELVGYVAGYDFDDAWFGKLAAVANDPSVEVLLAVGSGQTAFAGFKQANQKLGDIDCYTADSVALMESGTLDYLAGKFSASIGPVFIAVLSAVQGHPIRTEEGNAFAISQGYWVATSAEQAKEYFEVDSSKTEPAYTRAMLDTLYGASYSDLEAFVQKYSFEEIKELAK
ncbi:MAG: sugar ABC transporter substrate-binding protein [Lachnospiraceae bacterium]|nr:sugar ABC transporter substrate-binding protein [Lachnospiraceae bacterium]